MESKYLASTSASCATLISFNASQAFPHHPHQTLPIGKVLLQLRQQARVLLRERLAVVRLLFGTDETAWSEHEAVFGDPCDCLSLAEAGDVAVDPRAVLDLVPPVRRGLAAPLAERVDDAAKVGIDVRVAHAIGQHALAVVAARRAHAASGSASCRVCERR